MDFELILGLRSHIRIGSHTPGRLRLKIGLAAVANPGVKNYVKEHGFAPPRNMDSPGVHRTRFNPLTRSLTLEYDPQVIDPQLLHRLFSSRTDEDFERTAHELAESADFDMAAFCA